MSNRVLQSQEIFGAITASGDGTNFPVVPRVIAAVLRIRRECESSSETIQLGFGQRPRAFLFDGILWPAHERAREPTGDPSRGDRAFLHRFKHGRLRSGVARFNSSARPG